MFKGPNLKSPVVNVITAAPVSGEIFGHNQSISECF